MRGNAKGQKRERRRKKNQKPKKKTPKKLFGDSRLLLGSPPKATTKVPEPWGHGGHGGGDRKQLLRFQGEKGSQPLPVSPSPPSPRPQLILNSGNLGGQRGTVPAVTRDGPRGHSRFVPASSRAGREGKQQRLMRDPRAGLGGAGGQQGRGHAGTSRGHPGDIPGDIPGSS